MNSAPLERAPRLASGGPMTNAPAYPSAFHPAHSSSSYNYHYNNSPYSSDVKLPPPVGFRDDHPRPVVPAPSPPTITLPKPSPLPTPAHTPAQPAPSPAPSPVQRPWKIESHFAYQDGCWRCQHPACLRANSPQQADTGRRLMGVYKGSQSSPSTISRRAEQHTRKHWDEEAGGVGAAKGARKRKFAGREEGRVVRVQAGVVAVAGREEELGAKVDEREAVAALIGLGSASSGDERGPISPPLDGSSASLSRRSTTNLDSPPSSLIEPAEADRAPSQALPFPLASVLSHDKLQRVTALQDAQALLTEEFRGGRLGFAGWRERSQVNEVELAFLMGRAPTRIC